MLCFFLVVVHLNRSGDDQEVLFDQILMGQVDFPSPYWDNVSDSAKVGFQCLSFSWESVCLNAIIDFDSFCAKRPNDVVNTISVHWGYNYRFSKSSWSSSQLFVAIPTYQVSLFPWLHRSLLSLQLHCYSLFYTRPTLGHLRFQHSLWLYLFWVSTHFHPLREAFPGHPVFNCSFNLPSSPYLPHLLYFSL